MLGRLLRRNGFIAAEENDSNKATRIALRFQPDIVLLDLHMAWKDGHEVAREFSVDKSLQDIPIIFITAHALDDESLPGAIPILIKPFSLEDLFSRIHEGLSARFDFLRESDELPGICSGSSVTQTM